MSPELMLRALREALLKGRMESKTVYTGDLGVPTHWLTYTDQAMRKWRQARKLEARLLSRLNARCDGCRYWGTPYTTCGVSDWDICQEPRNEGGIDEDNLMERSRCCKYWRARK